MIDDVIEEKFNQTSQELFSEQLIGYFYEIAN